MISLRAPLGAELGAPTAAVLKQDLGIHTTGDLLRHYPRRYAERGALTDLSELREGEHVTVMGEIQRVDLVPFKQRRGNRLVATVTDGRNRITLTWFNQAWRSKQLSVGARGLFAGQVKRFQKGWELAHPDYELMTDDSDVEAFAGALIPVYPATAKISSWQIAKAVATLLPFVDELEDPVPADVRLRLGLRSLGDAFRGIHRPEGRADVTAATKRLKFDEAFVLQVALAQRRHAARAMPTPPRVRRDAGLVDAFDARLPFQLTAGQREVTEAIETDLAQTHPMHRLLQGEVGSGKTVVALRAMLTVVDTGGQSVLMAPTEVLATQHFRAIRDLLGPVGRAGELDAADEATRVVLLTGSTPAAMRRAVLDDIASGAAGIVIGTHALLEGDVTFDDLGLVVVDEQHRFGVHQRDVLRSKGQSTPHVLVMTATPIPRTVAMTVYGDLETSTLAELPAGRSPISSFAVPMQQPDWYARVWARVREEAEAGHQAYIVCPKIGGDVSDDTADEPVAETELPRRPALAVEDIHPLLRDGELAGLRVELLHGRLPGDVKDAVMRRFAAGAIDVLVATTVIEVGVDVPNATVMVVLDADRFGISQLHQLRGRVGRGSAQSWCLLCTEAPEGTPARERVETVASTLDGFELARHDLQQRREGDILGATQAGRRSGLRLLELLVDEPLILTAREIATALVEDDPELRRHDALASLVAAELDPERAEYLEKT